jgi:hypothetical protein
MLPSVAVGGARWLRAGTFVGAAVCGAMLLSSWRVRELAPTTTTVRAPWVESCAKKMEGARSTLQEWAPELTRAYVGQAWTLRSAWAELRLDPQYSARIEYKPGDDAPSVFDWEETETPVVGSFALHRRVGHFDLTVVADDADARGLTFAAKMQPLLDECLMEAQ